MPIVAFLALTNRFCLVAVVSLVIGLFMFEVPEVAGQHKSRHFTVADDIALAQIADPVLFSPDGRYFAVVSERGRLHLNRPESSVRVYLMGDIEHFLSQADLTQVATPLWTLTKSTYKDGPVITNLRWLADATGFVFLTKTSGGNDQLFLSDIHAKTVEPLTPENQDVTAFDVRSRSSFIYTVLSPKIRQNALRDSYAIAIPATGRSLGSLLFREDGMSHNVWVHDLSELWAVVNGRRFRCLERASGHPIPIHLEGQRSLAISPDGRSAVTALTVKDVPKEWDALYPPPFPSDPYRVRVGRQDPDAFSGQRAASEYVLIDLATGKTRSLTHAPTGNTAGWAGLSLAEWSADGQSVVLSNTFRAGETQPESDEPRRPCVAVADIATAHVACVERRKEQTESNDEESWRVDGAHFVLGDSRRLVVQHSGQELMGYLRLDDGSWRADATAAEPDPRNFSIDVSVHESLNQPPVLIAANRKTKKSRIIWDPNPQLGGIQMGEVSVFQWKDKSGRDWRGGLYKPPDYVNGRRYPLVIQTHGFDEQDFLPSGVFPTAFAAQELAAAGFLVLQVEDCPVRTTPDEGPCQVAGYEAAVDQLAADGSVDPQRVGIIGFSRTCYYVLESLTTSTLHFQAASITDGVDEGYLQYLTNLDNAGNGIAKEAEAMMGARPFGAGLQEWLKRSPGFNMDRVTTPLQVVALGRRSLLGMWEPYASLRYLNRPVDLIVVDSDEHVLTNPAAREVSQGGTVDWFRYWLQDYVDANPAKYGQYVRWKTMRAQRDTIASGKSGAIGAP